MGISTDQDEHRLIEVRKTIILWSFAIEYDWVEVLVCEKEDHGLIPEPSVVVKFGIFWGSKICSFYTNLPINFLHVI